MCHVLTDQVRDANPFFHLFESLWILHGRKDVAFLTEFNSRMAEYSDDGEIFNAPYGYRMRNGVGSTKDQIEEVIHILSKDPNSRQAVLQIWDSADLNKDTKDKACNMSVVFRIRNNELDMTVYNRSNDMIWGAYGANVVQFSMLHQYVAAYVNIPVGTYTQVSNSFHIYLDGPGGAVWDRLHTHQHIDEMYHTLTMDDLVLMDSEDVVQMDTDIVDMFSVYDSMGLSKVVEVFHNSTEVGISSSRYFTDLVLPMLNTYMCYKENGALTALSLVDQIKARDWRMAATNWLEKRL